MNNFIFTLALMLTFSPLIYGADDAREDLAPANSQQISPKKQTLQLFQDAVGLFQTIMSSDTTTSSEEKNALHQQALQNFLNGAMIMANNQDLNSDSEIECARNEFMSCNEKVLLLLTSQTDQ